MEKLRLVIILTLCFQTILIRAKLPDWAPPDIIELVAEDKKRCMDEHKVDQATIDKADNGDIPNEQNIKCYMHCMMESFSVVDEDGEIEEETFVGFLPEQFQTKARQSLSACANKGGADPCDKLYNTMMCFIPLAPELWYVL
uniref:Odorant binding protein 9 n=1 Tax=Sirex nitobei TaxID=1602346 RepID=A0A857N8Z2_9HYME|nr:odorant binding protein 9 [Sirex nitobei]